MTALLLAAILALEDTPEKTVRAFVDAFNARNYSLLGRQIAGGKAVEVPDDRGMPTLRAVVGETKTDGDSATMEADVELVAGPSSVQRSHETIMLKRVDGNWGVVPVYPERGGTQGDRFVGFLAYFMTNPGVIAQARRAARTTACLSNVKQLSVGTIMYSLDHDDRLPKAAAWKASIMPYLKSKGVFHCPEDASGSVSYFLDPRVGGKDTTSVARPAETAMIVEGTPKTTAFRHGGRASLGYVDGHAKSVDPAAMLRARTISLSR